MEALQKISRKLLQNYKGKILDIIAFGSSVREKFRPGDIDIAVVLKSVAEQDLGNLRKEAEKIFTIPVHLNLYRLEDIYCSEIYRTFLEEGVSLVDLKPLHQKMGLESGSIFSVDVRHLPKSKKVLFSYALHGKQKRAGALSAAGGREVGRAVFYIPISHVDEFKEFLELWKAEFFMMKILKE